MLLFTWKPACNSAFREKSAVPPRWMVSRVEGAMLRTVLPGVWACKHSQGAARSGRSANTGRVEQLNDGILEFLFPHGHALVYRGDVAFPVDQQRGGQRVQPAVGSADFVVAKKDAVVHLAIPYVGLDGGPTVFVHGHAEHGEALILELGFELHEPGDLDFARAAPGGPEVEQDHFASIVGKMDGLAVGVFQTELGGGFAILGGSFGAADCEQGAS